MGSPHYIQEYVSAQVANAKPVSKIICNTLTRTHSTAVMHVYMITELVLGGIG